MTRLVVTLVAALSLGLCTAVHALDTIKTTKTTTSGEITSIGPTAVVLEKSGESRQIPVNEIVSISFDDEPSELGIVRIAISNGRYNDALEALQKIDASGIERAAVKQDIEYYKAYCAAKLALAGDGEITAAGKEMARFVANEKDSWHWLEANQLVGDLLVANATYGPAQRYYEVLAKAPWPEYKMRAGVAIGRALLAEGKPDEAMKAFEGVLQLSAEGEAGEMQHMAATLGKARAMAEAGQHADAIKLVEEIIGKADPEAVELHARAYNTLGTALRKAEKPEDALLAFLHVDVLYFSIPEAHAEALANLAELWNELHKSERALQARQILEQRYKNSPWAQ